MAYTLLLPNLTNFPLNLVSCTQEMFTDLRSPDLPLKVPHLQCKLTNLQTYFLGDVVAG